MIRLALALSAQLEEHLIPKLLDAGYAVGARATTLSRLKEIVSSGEAEVALVESTDELLTESLLRLCDVSGVRLIALAANVRQRAVADSIGLLEVVAADAPFEQIVPLLESPMLPEAVALPPRPGVGQIIAVWGPPGAPGRTTIAANLAAELAGLGRPVTLVDADSYAASVAPLLGLVEETPGFAVCCRLAERGGFSREELARLSQWYESKNFTLRVLTGIARSSRWPELAKTRVKDVLETLKSWGETVVVDVAAPLAADEELVSDFAAPRRNAASRTAVALADHVIAVGSADPIGIPRFLREYPEALELSSGKCRVVMNRLRQAAVGPGAATAVRSTLARFGGINSIDIVPHDRAAFDMALYTSRVLADAAPRSAARLALTEIALDIAGKLTRPRTRRRMWRRGA